MNSITKNSSMLIAAAALLSLLGCGGGDDDNGADCGTGTTEVDGVCVPDSDPTECGTGTTLADGVCVPDVDCGEGTVAMNGECLPIVDCGPDTIVVAGECVVDPETFDRAAPTAVSGLAVTGAAAGFDVAWNNPSDPDFQGVVVVAVSNVLGSAQPTDGTSLTVGDSLNGHEVLLVGTDESLAHTTALTGARSYAAWAFDSNLNYSAPRLATGSRALATQTATIILDLDADTATVMTQPLNATLATSNAVHNVAGSTFQFDLDLTNDTMGLAHGPKIVVTSTEGALEGDGTIGEEPFQAFGHFGMVDGDTRGESLSIAGITSTTGTVALTVVFRTNPMILAKRGLVDSVTGASRLLHPTNSAPRTVRSTDDGRFGLAVSKREPCLIIADLTIAGGTARVCAASEQGLALGAGGGVATQGNEAYFAFTSGAHYNGGDGANRTDVAAASSVSLAVISISTLSVTQIIPLAESSTDRPIARHVALSADGSTLAVGVGRFTTGANEAWLVDTESLTVIDADNGTAGNQPAALSSDVGGLQTALFTNDGSQLLVNYQNRSTGENDGGAGNNGGDEDTAADIDVIDMTTFALSQIAAPVNDRKPGGMLQLGGDLIFPTDVSTSRVNLSTGVGAIITALDGVGDAAAALDPNGTHYWVSGSSDQDCRIRRVTVADDTVVSLENGDDQIDGTCGNAHGSFAITPF